MRPFIIGLVIQVLDRAAFSWKVIDLDSQLVQNGRIALEMMAREIRQATLITLAEADRLYIRTDLGEGIQEYVYYVRPGRRSSDLYDLDRAQGTDTDLLAEFLSSGTGIFQYWDRDNQEMSLPVTPQGERNKIVLITVILEFASEEIPWGGRERKTLRTSMRPRTTITGD